MGCGAFLHSTQKMPRSKTLSATFEAKNGRKFRMSGMFLGQALKLNVGRPWFSLIFSLKIEEDFSLLDLP